MSTPLEDKLVTWIRAKAAAGGALEMLNRVYSDPPRKDLSRTSFPRAYVKEMPSPWHKRGAGSAQRTYEAHVIVHLYVLKNDMVTKGGSAYTNPEQAVSKIATDLGDTLNLNWIADLAQTSDPFIVKSVSYDGAFPTYEFMFEYEVYKGEVHILGEYIR